MAKAEAEGTNTSEVSRRLWEWYLAVGEAGILDPELGAAAATKARAEGADLAEVLERLLREYVADRT